ncbi:Asd/ArgC dimerization domain-containing protein [Microbulbifer sp. GL-2]|uniref:Asd/ArgC dimerization domain-containing protein n=1 Tax=Microbulbifer sp. GL-2 TaxID=2591606 RepID=UPI0011630D57|nr:Asd/ArgC dimerization domain-containing protein [Microbulbifer sp. GL-2]BBM02661.1 aspartate-semialdehyde dehydrogenase [Microbulbifer sp. GL-2]
MSETARELVIVGVDNAAFAPLLEILEEREIITAEQLSLLETEDREVDPQVFANRSIPVQSLEKFVFNDKQVVILLSADQAAQAAMAAAEQNDAWVVDAAANTRGDETAVLIHPMFNSAELANTDRRVVALPSAGAAMVVEALAPLKDKLQAVEVQLSQPVSALGKAAIDSMAAQTAHMFSGQDAEVDPAIGHRLAFNLLSASEGLLASGHTMGELTLIHDLRRLLGEGVAVDASINTVSVFHGQLANLGVVLSGDIDLENARALLGNGARLQLAEQPSAENAVGSDVTIIGRLRQSLLNKRQLNFCAVSDNLRKDVAMNCAQIVHLLLKNY